MRATVFRAVPFLSILLIAATVASAHAISVWAEVGEDGKVHVEGYTSNGSVIKDSKVVVKDAQGNTLLEGKTDDTGKFVFDPPVRDAMTIELLPVLGHRGVFELKKEDFPVSAIEPAPAEEPSSTDESTSGKE